MKVELFNKIRATLETRICKCEQFLGDIKTTDDLKKLTIGQAQKLQNFCKEEEALMTKIVQCDLYHIIGMGNLTASQMMQFTYLIKDYLQYRSAIKTIAMNLDKISALPSIPVSAVYQARGFNLTLTTDPELLKLQTSDEVPYAVSGNMIQVLKEDLQKFIEFWSVKAKAMFSVNNFLQKVQSGAEYGGVRWTEDSTVNYVGIIKQDNVQQLFDGCYKKLQ